MPRKTKCIYLTFDDGPIPIVTPWVLETLKTYQAKATFFCIGDNIRKHPEIFEQLKADGHTVGNHTFNHLNGWHTEDNQYLDNINKCQELTQTHLFRPPYGRIKFSQIASLKNQEIRYKIQDLNVNSQISNLNSKLSIIMWDVLSGDFDENLSPEKCLDNVLKNTKNGSIVVFHDSLKAFKRLEYVLPKALKFWKKQGFEFSCL